jgi:hypothetical protein
MDDREAVLREIAKKKVRLVLPGMDAVPVRRNLAYRGDLLMDIYYPNTAWLGLRKDVFDRFEHYRSRRGLPTPEAALERLLSAAEDR